MKTLLLTALALIAFAANSVLCRMALGTESIDAATFTAVRLMSGAIVLWLLASRGRVTSRLPIDKFSAAALFAYAVLFSFAYNSLTTGTGALILFAFVQMTMITSSLMSGERTGLLTWVGLMLALAGMVYLVLPGVSTPHPVGATLMAGAGIAWGIYSLRGKKATDPLKNTAGNFLLAAPVALLIALALARTASWNTHGVLLAVTSGAIASGLGYVIWYQALRHLTAFTAATVQLSVPVIAAIGGVLFMSEAISTRLVLSTVAILTGILLVIAWQAKLRTKTT